MFEVQYITKSMHTFRAYLFVFLMCLDTSWSFSISLQTYLRIMHMIRVPLCLPIIWYVSSFPLSAGLLHWHCDNHTPVPVTNSELYGLLDHMNQAWTDYITTTKQSTANHVYIPWDKGIVEFGVMKMCQTFVERPHVNYIHSIFMAREVQFNVLVTVLNGT